MRTIILAALLISGCATVPQKPWYKAGGTQEQYSRDMIGCRQYGMQSATANGMQNNMFVEVWISRESDNCLQMLGYSR